METEHLGSAKNSRKHAQSKRKNGVIITKKERENMRYVAHILGRNALISFDESPTPLSVTKDLPIVTWKLISTILEAIAEGEEVEFLGRHKKGRFYHHFF